MFAIKLLAEVVVSSHGLTGERSISRLTGFAGRIKFLASCRTEGLSILLAVSWRLPSIACQMGLS